MYYKFYYIKLTIDITMNMIGEYIFFIEIITIYC